MELQTITEDQAAAQAAFREYRAAFMAERNRIDGELMRGYKALAQGKQLIRLTETIQAGGADDLGRPRLAIARADERWIRFSRDRDGAVRFFPNGNVRATDRVFRLPPATLPRAVDGQPYEDGWRMVATVPLIPPRFRPPHALTGYHLLWEAEWSVRAPRDPALLKRIGGDLFAVLAVWDLTELERAVLEMRAA